jgi:hypothetical protein
VSTASRIEWTQVTGNPVACFMPVRTAAVSADLAVQSSPSWLSAAHGSNSPGALAIEPGRYAETGGLVGLRRSGIRVRWLAGGPTGGPQRQPGSPNKPHQHDDSPCSGWQVQPDRWIPLVAGEPSRGQLPHHVTDDQQHPKQRSHDPHHQPLARGRPPAVLVHVHAPSPAGTSHPGQLRAACYRLRCWLDTPGAAAPCDDKKAAVQATGQWGGRTPKVGGRLLDGGTWEQMPGQVMRA